MSEPREDRSMSAAPRAQSSAAPKDAGGESGQPGRTPASSSAIADLTTGEYKYGFVTDIEADRIPAGLNEDIIRMISAKKNEPEFMLEWRLKAFRHWLTMKEPTWSSVH